MRISVGWIGVILTAMAMGACSARDHGHHTEWCSNEHVALDVADLPRSLAFCTRKLRDNLGYLTSDYGYRAPSYAKTDHLDRAYLSFDIDAVFDYGLHEFIQMMLTQLSDIGRQIEIDYRFYE